MAVVDRNFMTDGTGQAIAEGLASLAQAIENSGGGTEVVANPEGETPTDDLESLKVGNKTYTIPEGGAVEPLIVTVALDEEGYSQSESTYEDIIEAVSNNRPVFMNWSNPDGAQYFTIVSVNRVPLSAVINDEIDPFVRFTYIYCGDSDATFLSVTFKPEQGVFSEEHAVSWS